MKKEKIMVYFIAIIMVSSVFGVVFYGFNESSTKLKYNNYKFTQAGDYWNTKINNKIVSLSLYPAEVEHIVISQDITNRLHSIELDITSDINNSFAESIAFAQYSMGQTLSGTSNTYIRTGFTEENSFGMDIITCDDATLSVPVLYFKESNQTSINLDGNCIIIEVKNDQDVLRVKDRLLYAIFGIIG